MLPKTVETTRQRRDKRKPNEDSLLLPPRYHSISLSISYVIFISCLLDTNENILYKLLIPTPMIPAVLIPTLIFLLNSISEIPTPIPAYFHSHTSPGPYCCSFLLLRFGLRFQGLGVSPWGFLGLGRPCFLGGFPRSVLTCTWPTPFSLQADFFIPHGGFLAAGVHFRYTTN